MPKLTSLTVTYKIGIHRSLGRNTFSSAILEVEEAETYDVSDLDELAIEIFEAKVYGQIRKRLDERVEIQDEEWRPKKVNDDTEG